MGDEPEKSAPRLIILELLAYASRRVPGGILPVGHGFTRSRRYGGIQPRTAGRHNEKSPERSEHPNMRTSWQPDKSYIL
jgi:hypothetical protein